MTVTVEVEPMRAAVRDYYSTRVADAVQAMLADMEQNAPRDTGAMTQTVEITDADNDTTIARHLHFPQEYSSWQDEGTGEYAGQGRIYPTTAKVLHFFLKDGTEVFVRSVKGTPRTGWFTDTFARWLDFLAAAR